MLYIYSCSIYTPVCLHRWYIHLLILLYTVYRMLLYNERLYWYMCTNVMHDVLVMYLLYTMYLSSNTNNTNKIITLLYYSFLLFVVTLQIEWKHIYNTHTTTVTVSIVTIVQTYIHNIHHSYMYTYIGIYTCVYIHFPPILPHSIYRAPWVT